jgi:hypothetical protein
VLWYLIERLNTAIQINNIRNVGSTQGYKLLGNRLFVLVQSLTTPYTALNHLYTTKPAYRRPLVRTLCH